MNDFPLNKLAGPGMMFLIPGLYTSWKLKIANIFTSTSVNYADLSILLVDAIEKLLDCKLIVIVMVCDQSKNNVFDLIKDLKITKNILFVEIKGKKMYSIFNVPHVFKNFKNNFKSNNFYFKGKKASFKDFKDVHDINKNNGTSRSLLKIIDSHVNPGQFQLMSCE